MNFFFTKKIIVTIILKQENLSVLKLFNYKICFDNEICTLRSEAFEG